MAAILILKCTEGRALGIIAVGGVGGEKNSSLPPKPPVLTLMQDGSP